MIFTLIENIIHFILGQKAKSGKKLKVQKLDNKKME